MFGYKVLLLLSSFLLIRINTSMGTSESNIVILPPPCGSYLCTDEEIPVNATLNGECQKFGNRCSLGIENCLRKERGDEGLWTTVKECPKQCPQVCIFLFAPVCATNGCEFQTFSNKCFLDIYNCENESNFKVFSHGECASCAAKPKEY